MHKKTAARVSKLLAAIGETANVKAACKLAGVSRSAAYAWRDQDEDFRRAWDTAMKLGTAALEDEAARRAFEGFDEPVFYQGTQCGVIRKYSDTLATFLLKAHAPERFRERSQVEHTGDLTVNLTNEQAEARLLHLLEKATSGG